MKFQIKRSKNKEFYFVLIARNGNTLLTSETYKRKASCSKAISSLQKGISSASVFDLTVTKTNLIY
jgi:uncharacterized protein